MSGWKSWHRLIVCIATAAGLASGVVLTAEPLGAADPPTDLPMMSRPADFSEFWQTSLSRLAQWPIQVQVGGQLLAYRGMHGKVCTGVYHFPAGCQVSQAIIHIMDHGNLAERTPANDGFAHLGLHWYPPDVRQQWTPAGLPDRTGYLLHEAIVDACQAVNALLSRPEIASDKVGITGEGIGGVVAMAVAALNPQRISFVVVDRPWPVCHYNRGGPYRPTLEVAAALARLEARYPQWRLAIQTATRYFDMVSFAVAVKAPVLVLNGDESDQPMMSDPRVTRAGDSRGSRERKLTTQGYISPAPEQPLTWEKAWRQWAMAVTRQASEQARSAPAAVPGAVAELSASTDELFVAAEPVSLSWTQR